MTGLTAGPQPVRQLLRSLVGRHSADMASPEGRASERHRRAVLTAIASVLAKLVSVATALISIPLTLHYLGVERFGMWMTISSLVALLAFADFGIANGVLNMVADAHGREDRAGVRRAIASGLFILTAISLLLVAAFALAYGWVDWAAVFNVKSTVAAAEAGPALAVFVGCYAATIPLVVVQRAQMGLQQGFLASSWQCVGSVCGLVAVLLMIRVQAGLPWLVLALTGAPLLAALLNTLYFFAVERPELRPSSASVSRATCLVVGSTGAQFFLLQLAASITYSSDSFLIAQLLGADAVAQYAVPEKLFAMLSIVVSMALSPLWPAYGEAIARGDHDWVRRTLKRSLILAVTLTAAGAALLVIAGKLLVGLWVGQGVAVSMWLLFALAVWKTVEAAGFAMAMYLNAANVVLLQVIVAIVTCTAAVALKLLLVPRIGLPGTVWATSAAYTIFAAIPYAVFLHRHRRSSVPAGFTS